MREKILKIINKLLKNEITEKEAQEQFLFLFGVTKRITEAKDMRLKCGCDDGGSYMYYNEDGDYIKIEDVIKLINTINQYMFGNE